MEPVDLFRNPMEILKHDHFLLKDLFAEYGRLRPGEPAPKLDLVRRLGRELERHVVIEDRLLYPSLLSLKSGAVAQVVRTVRSHQAAILNACRILGDVPEEPDQERLMKQLYKEIIVYTEFEEKRVLPWTSALPQVTLKEISLEVEEMKGIQDPLPVKSPPRP